MIMRLKEMKTKKNCVPGGIRAYVLPYTAWMLYPLSFWEIAPCDTLFTYC